MATINEQMLDQLIGHEVDLSRLSNAQVIEIVSILNSGDDELRAQLVEALESLGDNYSQAAVDKALAEAYGNNKSVFERVSEALAFLITGVTAYEILFQRRLLITIIPGAVQDAHSIAGADAEAVARAVKKTPFQGKQIAQWADALEASRKAGLSAAIRAGIVNGLTPAQIVSSIMGTKAEKYVNGSLNKYRGDLEAIVVSAIGLSSNAAKEAVIEANSELVAYVEWVSVLDNRTTTTCIVRSGLPYTLGEFSPIGHKVPWLAGPGRIHFRCRSSYTVVFKSAESLGVKDEKVREIMDGSSPEHVNYAKWLDMQTADRQDEILGPVRGRLLRDGKLKVTAFFNDRGKFLTLDELRSRLE